MPTRQHNAFTQSENMGCENLHVLDIMQFWEQRNATTSVSKMQVFPPCPGDGKSHGPGGPMALGGAESLGQLAATLRIQKKIILRTCKFSHSTTNQFHD